MSSRNGVCCHPSSPACSSPQACVPGAGSEQHWTVPQQWLLLALAAEELIACLSLLLFLLIGHLWFLFQENFCLLSWMFWLTVFKCEKNTNKASASQLGLRWEGEMK